MGDGYEYIAQLDQTSNWKAISSYGLDGWDAGNWPLVVIGRTLVPTDDGLWKVVERVEGDITIKAYRTADQQADAVQELVEFYWRHDPTTYGPEIERAVKLWPKGQLPDRYKGEFSWERLAASKEAQV
jgi:hypothetical protein